MTRLGYRQAIVADAADILALLLQFAAEIPLLVDSLEHEEALYARIRTCARSGKSWVAVDEASHIVAVVLAERAQHARHYAEHEAIELRFAIATAADRGGDALEKLIGKALGGMVPVTATVSPHNRTGLAARLERIGFRPVAAPGEGRYRWQPGR